VNSVEDRQAYYRNSDVRARIREFLGAASNGEFSCEFLTRSNERAFPPFEPQSPGTLDSVLDDGFELCRSLWDGRALIADFDIEYVNFDNPGEAFLNPERVFAIQEPVVETIERILREYDIKPLHVLSGRGHHFIWRIQQSSDEFKSLSALGRGPPSLWKTESGLHPPNNRAVPIELAHAFAGLGLVIELLAHRVKQIAAPRTGIPVELTATEVGPSKHERQMISIDISEYGDPLYSREVRVPFSVYLKPWQQPWGLDVDALVDLPLLFVIPLQGIDWRQGIFVMRNPHLAVELSKHCSTGIPDETFGIGQLLQHYHKSKLAKFHADFYSQEQPPRERWQETYDRQPLEILPACARVALEMPNDLLLRPAFIRRLVRVMLALGWHPRHIAGLICSKYQRDLGWTQFVNGATACLSKQAVATQLAKTIRLLCTSRLEEVFA